MRCSLRWPLWAIAKCMKSLFNLGDVPLPKVYCTLFKWLSFKPGFGVCLCDSFRRVDWNLKIFFHFNSFVHEQCFCEKRDQCCLLLLLLFSYSWKLFLSIQIPVLYERSDLVTRKLYVQGYSKWHHFQPPAKLTSILICFFIFLYLGLSLEIFSCFLFLWG